MRSYVKFIIPAVILLIILAWIFWPARKFKPSLPSPATKKVEQINQLNIKDRPYVTLTPRSDGKEVTLTIDRVKNATKVEYELEYQAESLIQGVFGTIDFEKEPAPVSKALLFGSCSKGKCRYDEGVSGGSLTLRFEGGDNPYVLKSDFNLQNMFDRQGVFTSKDAKASLNVGRTGLPNNTFMVIAGTMGLPADLPVQAGVTAEVIAGPYAFLAASNPTLKNATITIQSKDDLTGAKLMFWNGKAFTELKAEISEAKISAPAISLGSFVVVK